VKRAANPEGRSVRTLKVGEQMRHVLADLLARGELRDDVLDRHIVSVSEVRVSPDLRHATAYIMPVGATAADQEAVIRALNAHARRLKGELARRVNTKYAADLHFRVDESYAEAARIDALLRSPRVARDLEDRAPPRIDPEADS
jgi:ribosome-binding factor A